MQNQPKIDWSLYWHGAQSPILMATSDYNLPVIQILKKESQTTVSFSVEFIGVVYTIHQLDDCPHLTILTHKYKNLWSSW